MGILRSGKGDTAPAGDRKAAASHHDGREAAEDSRRRLEDLFREYSPRVLDYARYRGASLHEAEEVVSDVFMVLIRRPEAAPLDPEEVLPWLFGVARKILGNRLRGSRRRQALIERSEEALAFSIRSAPDFAAVATDHLIILQGLARLRPRDREALLLVLWDGFQYDEAAVLLGCTPGAVAQKLVRARQLLLEEMGGIRTYRGIEGKRNSPVELKKS
jgi:RNA polymerase sigma-70 factor (ECF subfamily)